LTEAAQYECSYRRTAHHATVAAGQKSQQIIARRDDNPHADRGGSTSVRGRIRSPHSSGGLQASCSTAGLGVNRLRRGRNMLQRNFGDVVPSVSVPGVPGSRLLQPDISKCSSLIYVSVLHQQKCSPLRDRNSYLQKNQLIKQRQHVLAAKPTANRIVSPKGARKKRRRALRAISLQGSLGQSIWSNATEKI